MVSLGVTANMQKGDIKALEAALQQDDLLKLFVDLIAFDTQADYSSQDKPSSIGQLRLGAYLLKQLGNLKLKPVQTKEGVIMVKIPATVGYEAKERLCLLAHLDTATDASGKDVKPSLVQNYAGQGIELENGLVLDHEICPELQQHIGEDIVVTDGTTLLGGDDKAGIAVLMHLVEHCVDDRVIHGPLTIVFSVDEEIGRSTKYLDLKEINCDFAATIDGCEIGELDIATFNATGVRVIFKGKVVHTAVAYGKMKNALKMMAKFIAARCTVFAESDLVHKAQIGHKKEDIIAGLCKAVVTNYLNNVGKGKRIKAPIVFQGGVSKNIGVIKAFEDVTGQTITVDKNSHLMGALGVAILAHKSQIERPFTFDIEDINFETKGIECHGCANNCEIICVSRNNQIIDSWGNRCERGKIMEHN